MIEPLATFDGFLKRVYSADRIDRIIRNDRAVFARIKQQEIDALYAQMADSVVQNLWPTSIDAEWIPETPPPLTAAMVVTVATIGGLEWLRHRKAAVAAAKSDDDWKSLADEFWEWIAQLFRAWRLGLTSTPPAAPK